jgi:hypothetical protein
MRRGLQRRDLLLQGVAVLLQRGFLARGFARVLREEELARPARGVAVHIEFESKGLKPGYHGIEMNRNEQGLLRPGDLSYGSSGLNLCSPIP